MNRQNFGLIITNRSFFPAHLVGEARDALVSKLNTLGFGSVYLTEKETNLGAVVEYEEAVACAKLLRKNAEELLGIIVLLPNFGEESAVADAIELSGLDLPVLVVACDDDMNKLDLSTRRDAFCGKISVCNNLYQRGIKFSQTKTHTVTLESNEFTNDIRRFSAVCNVFAGLKNSRIAAFGTRPNAFHTVRFSEKLLQKHGVTVVTIDMTDVIATATERDDTAAISDKVAEIKAYGKVVPDISDDKLQRQARLCLTLEDFVTKNHCSMSAVQCWDAIQNHYGCATCLSMSMMGDKNLPSACEMDVTGAMTMKVLSLASGSAAAYMDWNNNVGNDRDRCITLHCSNFPKSFFNADIEIGNLDVLATTLGAESCFGACKAQVAEGPMTFCKITTDDSKGIMKAYVGEGEFLADHVDTKGGVAMCHVEDLQSLLHYICDNGYEHHVAFCRGHVADAVQEALERYMGIEVHRHKA